MNATMRTVSAQVAMEEYRQMDRARLRYGCNSMSAYLLMAARHMAGHYSTAAIRAQRPRRGASIENKGDPAAKGESTEATAPTGLPGQEEVDES